MTARGYIVGTLITLPLLSCGGPSNSRSSQVSTIQRLSEQAHEGGDGQGNAFTGKYRLTFHGIRSSNQRIAERFAANGTKDVLDCEQQDGVLECTSTSTGGIMEGKINADGEFTLSNGEDSKGLGYLPAAKTDGVDTLAEVIRGKFVSGAHATGHYYFAIRITRNGRENNGYLSSSMTMKRIVDDTAPSK